MMKHLLVVFGTRPEGIKMMPVVKAARREASFKTTVAVTGQHRQMLDQVFTVFGEKPDIDLNLMAPNQTLAGITANVVLRMSEVLAELKPDMMLVHGDTTTAMAAAMAGFYNRIPIGHVEAGLRSNDLQRPWPEEFNRVAIDAIADYMFAPTQSARENLLGEYNRRSKILVTGNTGIDALLYSTDPTFFRSSSSKYLLCRLPPTTMAAQTNNTPKVHIIVFSPPQDLSRRPHRCSGRETTSYGTTERS
jgi:UDP-N-acetylglucosamine 2-epimerase (non-hydrolysing)